MAANDRLIADILFDCAQQPEPPVDPLVVSWATAFDILREHIAASAGHHPLRQADLFT